MVITTTIIIGIPTDITRIPCKSALYNCPIGYVSHLVLIVTYEIAVLIKIIFQMRLGEIK